MQTPAEAARFLADAARRGPAALDDALGRLWPDEGLQVVHTPPAPSDGVMQRDRVLDGHRKARERLLAAMPDFKFSDVETEVDGDVVSLSYRQSGTLAGGERLSAVNRFRFTFRDGVLVELWAGADPAEMAPFVAIWSGATSPAH